VFVAPAISAGRGVGIAAVSADNIWAIIGGGAEQWNGTSWSQIANPKGVQELEGVTALSDGTVVAVGVGTKSGVIVSNNPPRNAAVNRTTLTSLDHGRPHELLLASGEANQTLSGHGNSPDGTPATAPLEAALLDQLFGGAGPPGYRLPSAGRTWWGHEAAADGAWDGLAKGLWLWARV
jgi:hypothetical protein